VGLFLQNSASFRTQLDTTGLLQLHRTLDHLTIKRGLWNVPVGHSLLLNLVYDSTSSSRKMVAVQPLRLPAAGCDIAKVTPVDQDKRNTGVELQTAGVKWFDLN
jgi:hypothetical protein